MVFVGRERELALLARPGGGRWRSGAASWSRSSAMRASASRGWRRRRSLRSRRGSSAAAACPTGSGSPTGRSWRSSSSSTRCRPIRPPRRRSARCSGRVEAGHVGGGDRLGVPQAARRAGAARRPLRRHPVGRGDVPRPGRARRAALQRRADPARLHGPAGAARAPPLLAGDGAARAAEQPGRGQPDRGGVPEELRARIAAAAGGNPLFIGEMLAMAGEAGAEVEVPPTLEGAARRPPRPARRRRAAGARARRGRGRGLPPRRRAGARTGGDRR